MLGLAVLAPAVDSQNAPQTRAEIKQLAKSLKYQQGEIKIKGGLATLHVPTNFNFLDANDAKTVLVKLWGNPAAQVENTLGLLMPADKTPLDRDCWVVTINYAGDGYVKDDDASKIDYDELLKKMQAGIRENNKARTEKGYPAIELVGWAASPHYDATTHKLYWAKDLKFEGETRDTLNYDVRILGRRGVLVLDAISSMDQLPDIEKQTPQILSMVEFNQRNRYADFDPKVDKVAAYGIAALVAGGVAAKLGFFKLIWIFLLAAKNLSSLPAWRRRPGSEKFSRSATTLRYEMLHLNVPKGKTMVKIIIGLVMIVGGLSGKLVLVGTNSGVALAVLGGILIIWGVAKMIRQKQGSSGNKS